MTEYGSEKHLTNTKEDFRVLLLCLRIIGIFVKRRSALCFGISDSQEPICSIAVGRVRLALNRKCITIILTSFVYLMCPRKAGRTKDWICREIRFPINWFYITKLFPIQPSTWTKCRQLITTTAFGEYCCENNWSSFALTYTHKLTQTTHIGCGVWLRRPPSPYFVE